jgi:D-erythronate 2-dehydrogenase
MGAFGARRKHRRVAPIAIVSPMKVVITGGGGFLGRMLALRLLEKGQIVGTSGAPETIDEMVLVDAVAGETLPPPLGERATLVVGDVSDPGVLANAVDRDDISVFHLASMVSSACELDFDAALAVNVDGCRAALEACRARSSPLRFVFSSSIAAFGGLPPSAIATDSTKLTPQTTYGATKAICELLVNDYTRKGFVDGRAARLPTVVIRPGRPNAAASSWVSSIFRERLNGEECTLPVDPSTRVPISGYRTVVENLVRLHEVSPADLGPDRAVNLPALAPTAQEMIDCLSPANGRPLGGVRLRPDPAVIAIMDTWAQHSSFERASRLGLVADGGLAEIVAAYLEDFAPAGH